MLYKKEFLTMSTYLFSNLLNALFPFLMLPILSRYLLPEQYGLYTIYILLVNCLGPFTGVVISRSIARNYVEQDNINLPVYISSCLVLSSLGLFFTTLIITIFSNTFSQIFLFPKSWLWTPIIASYGQAYLAVSLAILQMSGKPLAYGIVRVIHSFLLTSITLYMVVYLDWNWKGALIGHVMSISFLIPGLLLILGVNNLIKLKISYVYVIDALRYGAPLIPHVIGTIIITMIDRVFISHHIGMEAVGIYSVGYQISLVLFILITSISQVWTPWLFPRLKAGGQENKLIIVKATYCLFFIILMSGLIFYWISGPFMRLYLHESYFNAASVIPWLLMSSVVQGMHVIMTGILYYKKNTIFISLITLLSATASVVLNYILVPVNGIEGAAQASVLSFTLAFILTWYCVNKFEGLPWLLVVERK